MGGAGSTDQPTRQCVALPQLSAAERCIAHLVFPVAVAGDVEYCFLVQGPCGAPERAAQWGFVAFQHLAAAMECCHAGAAPPLPASTLFTHTDQAFVARRAGELDAYLQALLRLEPQPRTRALRRFLGVVQPWRLGNDDGVRRDGPLRACKQALPVALVAFILACLPPNVLLRTCSGVCRAMNAASRSSHCWPSLQFLCGRAEALQYNLFSLLAQVCGGLESLSLGLSLSESPQLAISLPAGIHFGQLRRLTLRIGDAEVAALALEILERVDSPGLRQLVLEGITPAWAAAHGAVDVEAVEGAAAPPSPALLLRALTKAAHGGNVAHISIQWYSRLAIEIDEAAALALTELLEVMPVVEHISIGIMPQIRGRGILRSMVVPPQPMEQMLMQATILTQLQDVTFDFLTDQAVTTLHGLEDRCWRLRRAHFSGSAQFLTADAAMLVLLVKLGDGLEEFSLSTELQLEMRLFMGGLLNTRIGALPALWNGRAALRSLTLSVAFDDQGVRSIVEHCPFLTSLSLERSEYWTDAVLRDIVERLPELHRLRFRTSAMLSDQSLYLLAEAPQRFECIELEPSYSMSSYALQNLQQRLDPFGLYSSDPSLGSIVGFEPHLGVVGLMAFVAGEPNPYAPPGGRAAAAVTAASALHIEGTGMPLHAGVLRILKSTDGDGFEPAIPLLAPSYLHLTR
eukprot:NODE_1599_length_2426_cov_5.064811.p1 GENE.NODE_1599_length_2426_cov_5.064811~~NODE_1599_length_2426_cov_5.064811.p1  ORF type:complete len:686 (+),score=190.01 NODE_1599_length_2426_cov_5.064811:61-2118(+)